MAEAKKVKHCTICGKPSEQTICETCAIKVQGEMLDQKHEVEKKGKVGTGRV
jgi:hypothetical protein